MQVNKICFMNFADLTHLEHLPWLVSQPSVASTMIVYKSLLEPLASSTENNHHKCNSRISQKKFNKNIYTSTSHNFQNFCRNIPSRWELSHNLLLFQAFLVGIP
jgi:hypothetical protein